MLAAHDALSAWSVDRRSITGPVRSEPCPGGSPGLVVPSPAGIAIPGAPLRVFEVMELRVYPSGGGMWLGARSVATGETIQPVAGPFSADGFALQLLDASGLETLEPSLAYLVQVRLKAEAGDQDAVAGAIRSGRRVDSLTVRIRLGVNGT